MKDWRKLKKTEIIHLVEALHGDNTIEHMLLELRRRQARLGSIKEVCYACRSLVVKLGLEKHKRHILE